MQRELLPGTEVQARGLLWEVVSVDPAGDQRLYLLRCLQEIRYRNELGSNPFDHEALGLVSVDFAKQEKVLQDLERTQYDVVVVDEAHHCFRLGKAGHRQDTQRRPSPRCSPARRITCSS